MPVDFRDAVFGAIQSIARRDPSVVVLSGDMGAMGLDQLREDFPDRVINAGISEQNMVSVAAGLAHSGKTVFVYAIIPHVIGRAYEQLKLDVCSAGLPVTVVGVGAGLTYGVDGPTHHGLQDVAAVRALPGIAIWNPADGVSAWRAIELAHRSGAPAFVRMDKEQNPAIHDPAKTDYDAGLAVVRDGEDVTLFATGVLTYRALAVAERLAADGVSARVVDLFRLAPTNDALIAEILRKSPCVMTIEENIPSGGLGTIVAEVMADGGIALPLRRVALPRDAIMGSARRAWGDAEFGRDEETLTRVAGDLVRGKTA